MVPDTPNAIKAERSLFARLCYFVVGALIGIGVVARFYYWGYSLPLCALFVFAYGLLGFFSSRRNRKHLGILDIFNI